MTTSDPDPTRSLSASPHEAVTALSSAVTRAMPTVEGAGSRIGVYKLLQQIGEGGFGSVFMAQQEQPVQRKVALKIIKVGMDTRQVVARFEQERQALAMMDHPNIARVLDAGATETGRPYFVMELCKGEPIVEYCDKANLGIDGRLELFWQVCNAVQHAHTKGIIHRDIKPSNILVSMQDGRPSAKVIDFGIAKATAGRLTEQTLFTEHRQLIGTPEYMSPEQAEGSLDIDTRTDVYSLGVLLYELLTGTTPFSSQELRSAAYGEIQRIIREVEPPMPSTRLSRNTDTLAGIAARRHTEPRKLGLIIRGELDWIVMKAMEKERQRRYETASGLGMDIQRYLNGEPVVAAPPGAAYRVRKFIGRHKGAAMAGGAVAAALLLGVVAFAWQASIARGQRDLAIAAQSAEAEQRRAADAQRDRAVAAEAQAQRRADELSKVSDFQASMLSQIDAADAGQRLLEDVRERFEKALEKGGVPPEQRASRAAQLAVELGEVNATDTAAAMIDRTILRPSIRAIDDKFKDQPAVAASLRHTLADLYRTLGLYQESLGLLESAVGARQSLFGGDDPRTLASQNLLADLYLTTGKADDAAALYRDTLERSTRVLGAEHEETLSLMGNLGNVLRGQGKFAEAEPLLRGSLDGRRRVLGNEHRETLIALNTYGYLLIAQGKLTETEPYWREAYETGKRVLGTDHADTLIWTANIGGLLMELGRSEEAASMYREAAEGFRRVRGEEHPYTLACLRSLGQALTRQGKLDEAEKIMVRVLEAQRRTLGSDNPETLDTMAKLGANQRDQGKLTEGIATLRASLAGHERVLGREHFRTLDSMGVLAGILATSEQFDESNSLYREQLEMIARVLGEDHKLHMVCSVRFADSLTVQGKLDEAEPLVRGALERLRRVLGPTHPETGTALARLGELLRVQKKPAEAEVAIREAVSIFRASLGQNDPGTFSGIAALAEVLLEKGELDEAESLCREALAGLERVSHGESPRSIHAHRTLGRLLTARKQFKEAEVELLTSERIASAARVPSTRSLRRSAQALTDLYVAWHAAEPGHGYDAKASEWKLKLEASERATPKPGGAK